MGEATKLKFWNLLTAGEIPSTLACHDRISQVHITGRVTLIYTDTFNQPNKQIVSFDRPHLMNHAITATSALGFLLRDLNKEFASRFADELTLCDKQAHTLASQSVTNRGSLNATIGEGNCRYFKYPLLGHCYLFRLITMEEVARSTITIDERT
jgi:hypothetical protein